MENQNGWRIVIHSSRYSGVYEGGKWFAMYLGDEFPEDSIDDDVSCAEFFAVSYDSIGIGRNPEDALTDLLSKNKYAKDFYEKYIDTGKESKKFRGSSWMTKLKLFVARLTIREFR